MDPARLERDEEKALAPHPTPSHFPLFPVQMKHFFVTGLFIDQQSILKSLAA